LARSAVLPPCVGPLARTGSVSSHAPAWITPWGLVSGSRA